MTLEDSIHASAGAGVAGRRADGQCECGVPSSWRVAHGVLPAAPAVEQYGPDGVHPKRRRAAVGRPSALPVQTERRVIALALAWPTWAPSGSATSSPARAWRWPPSRSGGCCGGTARHAAGPAGGPRAVQRRHAGMLTERTAHAIGAGPCRGRGAGRLVVAGHVLCGQAERRGQGLADHGLRCRLFVRLGPALVGEVTSAAVLAFLREVVRPAYRRAGMAAARVSPITARNSEATSPPV